MADPAEAHPDPEIVALSFQTFMRLPPVQRSSVILMDVLGYSLGEIGETMDARLPAVKSALHRGRTRLHELAAEPDAAPPSLSEKERTLLARYIDRFNAHDYDALRAMLAEDVRLDLVNRRRIEGAEVRTYYTNYARATPRDFRLGFVDGHPAILVYERAQPDAVSYFIALDWRDASVSRIRDFLYAPYALDGAEVRLEVPQP